MNILRNLRLCRNLTLFSIFAVLALSRCAPPDGSSTGSNSANGCTPTVIDSNLALMVQPLGGNVYSFQVCASSVRPNQTFSVYGGNSHDAVAQNNFNVQAAERRIHISDADANGSTFQVTFLNSDLYFAIYPDQMTDTDILLDGSQTPLMSPHRLPGR